MTESLITAIGEVLGILILMLVGMWWADKPTTTTGPANPEPAPTTAQTQAHQRDLVFLEAQAITAHNWPRVWDDALRIELPA